ncbi:MAG: hypothetical protein ING91_19280 [Rhodocyclaceae bacterium]|nr:hypothetical protein [Rhodocyclaceae bacterium]MCA3116377.1 hypothetical protein [Rhodocyclaceae bacterium]
MAVRNAADAESWIGGMKTIIAGSRRGIPMSAVRTAWESCPWKITTVLCGCSSGVDQWGAALARESGLPVEFFPADWDQFGKAAGPIRNRKMLRRAQALIAVWDGRSPGTLDMITAARKAGIPTHIITEKARP